MTSTELHIPTEARAAGYDALLQAQRDGRDLGQGYASALEAALPGILAAELRRLGYEKVVAEPRPGLFEDWDRGWLAARGFILARAEELDPRGQ